MNKFTTPKPKKLIPPTPSAGRARPQPPFPFFPFLVLVFLIIIVFGVRLGLGMSGKYLEGTEGYVYLDEDGNPQVIPEVREQLKRQKQNREDCVQYAAVATEEGYRACYSCPNGQKNIFLRSGEIWKFGETCDLKSRNNAPEYKTNNVVLIAQNFGTKDYCFKIQLDSIYLSKIHPENLRRLKETGIWFKRLPGNKIYR